MKSNMLLCEPSFCHCPVLSGLTFQFGLLAMTYFNMCSDFFILFGGGGGGYITQPPNQLSGKLGVALAV